MPIARFEMPDGRIARFEVPDGTSPEEAQRLIASSLGNIPAAEEATKRKGIGAALGKGTESFLGAGQTTLESLFGANKAAERGLAREEALGKKYEDQIGLDKLKEAYEKKGLTGAGGELLRQVPLAFAEQAPQIAASLGSARLGAMAGSAFGPIGTGIGAVGGALLPSATQLYGSFAERQAAEQQKAGQPIDINVGKALGATAIAAPLDVVATYIPLGGKVIGKMFGPEVEKLLMRGGTKAAEKLAQEGFAKTLGKGLVTGAAAEIPTEIAQQVLERAQAGLALTSPDALKEYGETAYQAGLLSPIGGAGRFIDKSGARTQVEAKKDEDRRIAAEAAKEQQRIAQEAQQTQEFQKAQQETGQLFGEALPEATPYTPPKAPSTLTVAEREAQAEQAKTTQTEDRARLLKEADTYDKQLLDIEKQRDAAAEKGDFKQFSALDAQARALEESSKKVSAALKELPVDLTPDMEMAKLRGEQKNLIKQLQGMTGPSYDAKKAAGLTAKLEEIDKRITEITPGAGQMELFDEAQMGAEERASKKQQAETRAQEQADLFAQVQSATKTPDKLKTVAEARTVLNEAYAADKSDAEIYALIERVKELERAAAGGREVVSKDAIYRYQKGLQDLEDAYAENADERSINRLIDNLQRVGQEKDEATAKAGAPTGAEQEEAIVKLQRIKRAIDEEAAKLAGATTDEEVNAIRTNIGALQKRYGIAQTERAKAQPENVEVEASQEQRDAILQAVENVRLILSGEYINSRNVDVASSLKSTLEDRIRDAGGMFTTAAIKEINAVRAINKQQPLTNDEGLKLASAVKSRFDFIAKDPTYLANREIEIGRLKKQLADTPKADTKRRDRLENTIKELEKNRNKNLTVFKDALERAKVALFKGPTKLQKERPLLRQQFGKPEKEEAGKSAAEMGLTVREKEAGKQVDVSNINLAQKELFGEKELEPVATVRATPQNFQRFVGIQANKFKQAKQQIEARLAAIKAKADAAFKKQEEISKRTQKIDPAFIRQIEDQRSFVAELEKADEIISNLRFNAEQLWTYRSKAVKHIAEVKADIKKNGDTPINVDVNTGKRTVKTREKKSEYVKIKQRELKEFDATIDENMRAIDSLHARANELANANIETEKNILASMERRLASMEKPSQYAQQNKEYANKARAIVAQMESSVENLLAKQVKEKRTAEEKQAASLKELPFTRQEVVESTKSLPGGKEMQLRRKVTQRVKPVTAEEKRQQAIAKAKEGAAERKADKEAIKARLGTSQIVESKELTAVLNRQAGRGAERIAAQPPRKERKKPLKTGVKKVDVTKQGLKAARDVEQEARDAGVSREDYDFVQSNLEFGFKAREETAPAATGNVSQADVKRELAKLKLPKGLKIVVFDKLGGSLAEKIAEAGHDPKKVRGGVLPDGTVIFVAENHTDLNDVKETIAHELIGHLGVEKLLGEAGMRALAKQIQKTENSVFELAKKLGVFDDVLATYANSRRTKSEEDSVLDAVRELIAHTEETTPTKNFLEKARDFIKAMVGAVRASLRKMGLELDISTSDIYKILRDARKQFNEGSPGAYVNKDGDILFRTKPAVANAGFEDILGFSDKIVAKEKSLIDKIKGEATGLIFKTKYIDRFAPVQAVAKGMEDSLKATQLMYFLRMHDQRMAWTSEIASNGPMELKKAADGKGLILETTPGANLKDMAAALREADVGNAEATSRIFTMYLAAKRAKNVGLDKLNFSEQVTQKMLDDTMKAVENNPATKNAFEKAAGIYNEYNKGLINFAVQTGAISKDVAAKLLKDKDYVPFYRQRGDGSVFLEIGGAPAIKIGNLKDQPYLHELVGGDKPIFDVYTSALQNTSMLTDMALRNLATRNVAFALGDMGLLKVGEKEKGVGIHKGDGPTGPTIVHFKIDGENHWASVNTDAAGIPAELLVKGLEGVNTSLPNAVKAMNVPANLLRKWVTRNPAYALRQVIRDPLNAVMTSGLDTIPVVSSFKEISKMIRGKSEGEPLLQRRGILGGQVLTGTAEDTTKILRDITAGKKGWDYRMAQLDQLAIQGDASTRVVMYNNFIKQGLSEMEATLATLEAMNFSKRGISPSLFALSTMVPFMNAQIQGLNVLYQAFTGKMPFNEKLKVKQKLVQRGLMMMAFTMLYASMMEDDESYKNANDDERYGNWFVPNPLGEEYIKVPIPFEIGLIFKAIPEAVVNTAFGDQKARDALSAIGKMTWNSIPISSPQGIKPALEIAINHSFFTGRSIESDRLQRFEPGERYDDRTSEISKLIGGSLNISPVKLDYLIRGYTGSLPLAVASLANPILRGTEKGEQPESRGMLSSETPLIGSFFQAKDAGGLVNKAYKDMAEINQSKETYNKMVEEGRDDEAQAYVDANADMIGMASFAGTFRKKMGDLTKAERRIRSDQNMSGAQKRAELDAIKQDKIALAKDFISARE